MKAALHVSSNLATSLDGKIATASREFFALGTPADRKLMQVLRRKSDVVVFGATTLRTFRRPCIVYGTTAKGLKHQPANAVVSNSLEGISPDWPFFLHDGFKRLLFVGSKAPAARLKRFSASCEIIKLDDAKDSTTEGSVAEQVVAALTERGYRRALVEGGGQLMWDFASRNLIDEYYVTLTPRILGGSKAPTLVDGKGFEPGESLNLKLKQCRKLGDELYLIYTKTKKRG